MAKKIHRIKHEGLYWRTYCGEHFWDTWKGTTEKEDVTCKNCKRVKDKDND